MTQEKSKNIYPTESLVSRVQREDRLKQHSFVLWFTGLSGAGKSTLANQVQERIYQSGRLCYMLDGDNIRKGLCSDLGFSSEDRDENIRRIAEVSALMADAGVIVMSSFISPLVAQRENARKVIGSDFIEVYCQCPIEICEKRDVKGLYKLARDGKIPEFTGVSSPYEAPPSPEINIDTGAHTVEESVDLIFRDLERRKLLPPAQ
ncbi:MAG: adenylyl-sulfate kinase [Gammaproteobacteria bacterium]|nr:adenylyl-sulfate kinase [Gammaproteobacteria bacterium]